MGNKKPSHCDSCISAAPSTDFSEVLVPWEAGAVPRSLASRPRCAEKGGGLPREVHFQALPYQSDMHMYCSCKESSWLVLGLHQSSLGAPKTFIEVGKSRLKTVPSTAYEEQLPIAAILWRAEIFLCAWVCQRHRPTIKDGREKFQTPRLKMREERCNITSIENSEGIKVQILGNSSRLQKKRNSCTLLLNLLEKTKMSELTGVPLIWEWAVWPMCVIKPSARAT